MLLLCLLLGCSSKGPADTSPPEATMDTLPGCDPQELEAWLEVVMGNAQAFRDDSFGLVTLPPEEALVALDHLSSLREVVYQAPVPDCVAPIWADLALFMENVITAVLDYSQGRLIQADMIVALTTAHRVYDEGVKEVLILLYQDLLERQ